MKKTIPSTVITTCDICGETDSFKCDAVLKIKRHGLDWTNTPVADASSSFDLCDACIAALELKIQAFISNKKIE